MNIDNVIADIEKEEGFSGTPYKDSLGFDTIGYGTLLPLSRKEAEAILKMRLEASLNELSYSKAIYQFLPDEVKEILANMVYQLGVPKLLQFKKMWNALDGSDYKTASEEMINSRWAKQTPARAKRLADRMAQVRA